MDVNIFTQIGLVVLVGLASKNAILIVEFAKQQQEAGVSRRDATLEACRLRLRPILMTSFAFILGVVPLVLAEGAGAEMRRTLGMAVFSGMLGRHAVRHLPDAGFLLRHPEVRQAAGRDASGCQPAALKIATILGATGMQDWTSRPVASTTGISHKHFYWGRAAMRAVLLAFVAICANALILAADDAAPPSDLRPLLKEVIDKKDVPGAAAAIVRGDRVVALGSAGVRKIGDAAEFQPSDCVHLGSDTKAMTALLIGQLIDRKQLSFDTPMSQAFPDLAEKMNAELAKVTVRDLLDHTAGLPANLLWGLFDATGAELTKQRRSAVEQALTKPPSSKIGEFSYSNTGYVILARSSNPKPVSRGKRSSTARSSSRWAWLRPVSVRRVKLARSISPGDT